MKGASNRVVVGMSGGVDSSVAAALLAEKGYEVIGVSLNLLSCDRPIERSCCSAKDREDARAVCEQLGIAHSVVDCRARFREGVIEPFIRDYLAGRTPSPCILCNELVKFPALLEEAKKSGAKFVATGHYARVTRDREGSHLLKGSDAEKDQSYFLFGLDQTFLSKIIFPLGGMTKMQTRRIAEDKCLRTRAKPDSQEVCFVPDDDYMGFIEDRAGADIRGPGNFIDTRGKAVGRHKGIHSYTIGQRRGLGFGIGKRQYVVRIDAEKNDVVLGGEADLMRSEMIVDNVSWTDPRRSENKRATVKIRSTHEGVPCSIEIMDGGRAHVRFDEPVRAIAPGQAAVFYDGDEVLGGGWIG